jgi:hypothetical protein
MYKWIMLQTKMMNAHPRLQNEVSLKGLTDHVAQN